MSIQLVQKYYAEIDKIIRYGGSRNESSLRKPFQDLLEGYARAKGLVLVAEVELESKKGTRIRPDGVLKDALRQDWGFWESKDEKDKIEDEIKAKFNKGYPSFNILFEDTHTAILYLNVTVIALTGEFVVRAEIAERVARLAKRLVQRGGGLGAVGVRGDGRTAEVVAEEVTQCPIRADGDPARSAGQVRVAVKVQLLFRNLPPWREAGGVITSLRSHPGGDNRSFWECHTKSCAE